MNTLQPQNIKQFALKAAPEFPVLLVQSISTTSTDPNERKLLKRTFLRTEQRRTTQVLHLQHHDCKSTLHQDKLRCQQYS